jgi:hypothetical protein
MTERKRGHSPGNWFNKREAKQLEGLTWDSWKYVLRGRLEKEGLTFPNSGREQVLHSWFVLRRLRKLNRINEDDFEKRKQELFEGKDDLFLDKAFLFSVKLITEKTEKLSR